MLRVLNLASGPGRDMQRILDRKPPRAVHFDCVEQDLNAIQYAREIYHHHLEKVTFIHKNVLRFSSPNKYDLVWSAGIFDYFDDKVFVRMLKRMTGLISSCGEIVIGNFSPVNPSRAYMEIFEWRLQHRSPQKLRTLAKAAGFGDKYIRVDQEDTGVNLFLHVRSPGD